MGLKFSDMKKLEELKTKCKCGVSVEINQHKNYYEKVEDNIFDDDKEDIPNDVLNKMIELDTIVRVQFYPNTPVGCYVIYHYDLEEALDEALNILN